MASKKLLLIGAGGHCRSVLDCIISGQEYDEIGIVEREICGGSVLGIPVIGTDADLPQLFAQGWTQAVITVGSVGDSSIRRKLYSSLKKVGFKFPSVIDPSAMIGRETMIGEGVFIGKRVVVNTGTQLATCAIINTGAILEHDCRIGEFSHIAPGTTLCGEVSVGEDSHIGAGSVVRQQLQIGRNSLIGAGSVVVKNIPDRKIAFGNPCREVSER